MAMTSGGTPRGVGRDAVAACRADIAQGMREHYEFVSKVASDWHSGIPQAIDAWERIAALEEELDSEYEQASHYADRFGQEREARAALEARVRDTETVLDLARELCRDAALGKIIDPLPLARALAALTVKEGRGDTGLNIDFQIYPESHAIVYKRRPRVRIDSRRAAPSPSGGTPEC